MSLLAGSYDYRPVTLSALLALSSSYSGFALGERTRAARRGARFFWLICGGAVTGLGVWASQYIAILAFNPPFSIRYHYPTLMAGLLAAICATMVGLFAASLEGRGIAQAIVASLAVGGSMAAIPLLNIASMRMSASLEYRWGLAAIVIAFGTVIFLLLQILLLRLSSPEPWRKLIGSITLGSLIAVVPYVCIGALTFHVSNTPVDLTHTGIPSLLGVVATAGATFLILLGAVIASRFEQLLESQEAVVEKAQESEAFFRSLSEAIPGIIWTARADGTVDFASDQFYNYGYSGEPPQPNKDVSWEHLLHPDDVAACLDKWSKCVRTGEAFEMEYRLRRHSDGTYHWFLARGTAVRDDQGQIIKWFGTSTDIEDQKQSQRILEEQIRERTEELAEANTRLQEEMWEKDLARKELDEQNERMLGELNQRSQRATMLTKMGELLQSCLTRDEVFAAALGFAPKVFLHPGAIALLNHERNLVEVIGSWANCNVPRKAFEPDACWALRTGHEHLVIAGDSTARCAHAAGVKHTYLCVPILAQGEALGIMHFQATDESPSLAEAELSFKTTFAGQVGLSMANISLRDALRNQSIKDTLTGLYNRRYLEEVLDREIRRGTRAKQSLGILMLDLDHFKTFNDTYGHDAGDAVLRESASLLTRSVRAEDTVCRFGGEEFVILLPTASSQDARERAEVIRSKMSALTVLHRGRSLGMITVSIGVCAFPMNGTSPQELLAAADAALYGAKRNGRDRVVVAEQLTAVASDHAITAGPHEP
jgi:diguanylate cyclase (GGDEF)-like protein/PAS domain S-box-containing protein